MKILTIIILQICFGIKRYSPRYKVPFYLNLDSDYNTKLLLTAVITRHLPQKISFMQTCFFFP